MSSPRNTLQDDALVLVHLRNDFYRKKMHLALSVTFLSFIVIAVLISVLIYLTEHPTHPLYFVTDQVGRLIVDVPKDTPNMSADQVGAWAAEATEKAYSYDYINYRQQFQNAQKYFTDYGWRNYMNGLKTSNNLIALSQRKYVIIAKTVEKPRLINQAILGGAYAWKFQLPLLVTYLYPPFDAKSSFQNPVLVTVIIQRQSILTSYKGLGVIQMNGNLILNPTQQNFGAPPAAT